MKIIILLTLLFATLITSAENKMLQDSDLPAHFDLRDVDGINYLGPVKDQLMEGPCWTFAASNCIESNWRRWWGDDTVDISEAHMSKCHGYEFGVSFGGSEYTTGAYLSRLSGPIKESSVPYSSLLDGQCIETDKNADISGYVNEMYWVRNDNDLLKRLILEHGPVATLFNRNYKIAYYNPSDFTSFYDGLLTFPHAVTIVGWNDDLMPRVGYKTKPKNPGVWIVRNSWGTENTFDEQGYFYVSYEDNFVGRAGAVCEGKTPIEDIDTVLAYDYLGATYNNITTTKSDDNIHYVATKYTANQDLFLTHFSTYIFHEGTSLDMTICRSFDGNTFSDTLYSEKDIYCEIAGCLKINFPTSIPKGDFYLIAGYHHPSGTETIPKEQFIQNYSTPVIEKDKMWLSTDAESWITGGLNTDYEYDLAVKLIARYPTDTSLHFTVSEKRAFIGQTIELKSYPPPNTDSLLWCLDGDSIRSKANEKIYYSFDSEGRKDIILRAYKNGKSYKRQVKNALIVVSHFAPQALVVMREQSYAHGKEIYITGAGADSYEWTINGTSQENYNKCISTTLDRDSTWVMMKGYSGEYTGYDTLLILSSKTTGDNIEDAHTLTLDVALESATHRAATAQENEPVYNGNQIEYANNGLSSIWLQFEAPETGSVTIESIGLGQTLSLYDATHSNSYHDILSGDSSYYKVLVQCYGDDSSDYTITSPKINNLTPGKTYWIQLCFAVDANIKTSIIVNTEESTSLSQLNNKLVKITNTPTLFKATIPYDLLPCEIQIFDIMGHCIYQHRTTGNNETLAYDDLMDGVYIININTKNGNLTNKMIKEGTWELQLNSYSVNK